jgi:hypothetical protein
MTTTRNIFLLTAITIWLFAACNYTDGECWYYGQGTESAGVGPGGGVIIPTGAGGYGEAPPKQPQDATGTPPPVCNIVSLSPCHDKCDEDDEARSIECGKIQYESQRRACQDSSHEKYKSCLEECERTPSKSKCQKKWENCTNYGPWECARPGSGSEGTKCRDCYRSCESGNPTSDECKKCLF